MSQTDEHEEATTSDTASVSPERRTRSKRTSKNTAPSEYMTPTEIQDALQSLERRMKRADKLTRKSVKTLEDVVSTLDARTKLDSAAQKSALSRRVGQLSNTLEESMATTREEIRTTLAKSLTQADIPSLETAIRESTSKLKTTETQQAKSIARINRHLANLARAVEDRIVKDQIAATEALHQVEIRLSNRLSTIETDTAKAITTVGGRVEKLSDTITQRQNQANAAIAKRVADLSSETQAELEKTALSVKALTEAVQSRETQPDAILAQKISDLAAQTQAEFDKTANSIEARLEKLEQAEREAALIRPDALSQDMNANVSTLSSQVETLQSRLDSIDASFTALQTQTNIMSQDLMQLQDGAPPRSRSVSTNIVPFSSQKQNTYSNPYASQNVPEPSVAESGGPTPATFAAPIVQPSARFGGSSAEFAEAEFIEYVPEEFDPTAYAPMPQPAPVEFAQAEHYPDPLAAHFIPATDQNANTAEYAAQNPMVEPQAFEAPALDRPQLQNNTLEPTHPQSTAPQLTMGGITDVDTLPVGDLELPYADPAYAETEERMDAMRIGGDTKKTSRKFRFKRKPKAKTGQDEVKIAPPPHLTQNPSEQTPPQNDGSSDKKPLLTARNLRVGALATGITLVGLLAARSFLPAPLDTAFDASPTLERAPISSDPSLAPTATNTDAPVMDEAVQPIGVYVENATPNIAPSQAGTLEAAARDGDPIAEYQLGLSYLEQGRTEDGAGLIRKAATTLPAAQYRLAKLYDAGMGVEKDAATARELTERAARGGNRIAMHDLAIYYAYGNGDVSVDMTTAAGWFEKAAERGVVDSQFNLAILYENGQGVTASPSDAYFWYSIAAAQGDQTAEARVATLADTMETADLDAARDRIAAFKPVKINPAANGVFRNLPWSQNNTGTRKAQVKQAQTLLSDLGFEVGKPDGIMGRKTREAIVSFERVNGLEETGRVSAALLDKLSSASGA